MPINFSFLNCFTHTYEGHTMLKQHKRVFLIYALTFFFSFLLNVYKRHLPCNFLVLFFLCSKQDFITFIATSWPQDHTVCLIFWFQTSIRRKHRCAWWENSVHRSKSAEERRLEITIMTDCRISSLLYFMDGVFCTETTVSPFVQLPIMMIMIINLYSANSMWHMFKCALQLACMRSNRKHWRRHWLPLYGSCMISN